MSEYLGTLRYLVQDKLPADTFEDDDDDDDVISYRPKRRRTLELSDSEDEDKTVEEQRDEQNNVEGTVKGKQFLKPKSPIKLW